MKRKKSHAMKLLTKNYQHNENPTVGSLPTPKTNLTRYDRGSNAYVRLVQVQTTQKLFRWVKFFKLIPIFPKTLDHTKIIEF
mmetsp:Transcript_6433/g.9376  ORF Transcript_6433/g.9376 Transcript_6433/m.9376 type:complete len:82 (+) Transcript_6433:208-453(+)